MGKRSRVSEADVPSRAQVGYGALLLALLRRPAITSIACNDLPAEMQPTMWMLIMQAKSHRQVEFAQTLRALNSQFHGCGAAQDCAFILTADRVLMRLISLQPSILYL